jgi:hypothetical protein
MLSRRIDSGAGGAGSSDRMWSVRLHALQSRRASKLAFELIRRRAGIGLPIALPRAEGSTEMPLLNIVVILIVVGVGLHLINRYVPMASSIKTILNVVVIVVVCVWLLQATGLWAGVTSFRLGK